MKNYYSILQISHNASTEDIEKAYKELCIGDPIYLGNSDYDNINEFIAIKDAYTILSDRNSRIKYDIRNLGKIEYFDSNFLNKNEIDSCISVINEEIIHLYSDIYNKDNTILNLNSRNQELTGQLLKDKTDYTINIELERNKSNDLEKETNRMLAIIDKLKSELDVLYNVKQEKDIAENKISITEKHNQQLLNIARNHRNFMFKIISVLCVIFFFITLIVYINA